MAQTFPVFTIKAFQWLRRCVVLLPKRPDWHQDNFIAPMLRPKLLESISKETWQFLYSIMCIEEHFSPSAKVATSLLGLVPSVLCSRNVNLNAAVNTYTDDLPSPELFVMELTRWGSRYLAMEPQLKASFTCCGNQRL